MIRHRAAAIILREDNLLVMKRDKHGEKYYSFPGGGIERGETPIQTVSREIKEETCLEVEVGPEIYRHTYENGEKQYYFLCKYISGTPKFTPGINELVSNKTGDLHELVWLPMQKLPETLLYPLEIRDWLIEDIKHGFPKKPRIAKLTISKLRQTL